MYRYLIAFTALLLAPFTRPSPFQIAREQIDSTAIHSANIRTDDATILMGTDAVRRGGIKPIDLGRLAGLDHGQVITKHLLGLFT
jgi:hypothetical protein